MVFDRPKVIAAIALACALAWAGVAPAQTDQDEPEPPETIGTPLSTPPESISPGTIVASPPAPIERLPSTVSFDPPVPYYSQMAVPDDVPQFSPQFELSPREVKLGMIASVEASYVQPFIHNGLNSGTLLGNLPETIQVPTAQPSWTTMPRVDLGYRFEQGLGELHVSFQFLGNQGTQTINNFDTAGAGTVTSRLNVDVLDVDYAFTEFNPGRFARVNPALLIPGRLGLNLHPEDDPYPMFRMKWAFGARMANVFFDSRGSGQQILQERVTNNFAGGGMHASVDFSKPLPWMPALGVFTRFEASGLIGQETQSFTRTEILPGGGTAAGSARLPGFSMGVPVIDLYAGMSYTPRWLSNTLRVTGGYRLQQWWYLGQTASSQAGLFMQGFFIRGEFGY